MRDRPPVTSVGHGAVDRAARTGRDILVEDLVELLPESVPYLMGRGIQPRPKPGAA